MRQVFLGRVEDIRRGDYWRCAGYGKSTFQYYSGGKLDTGLPSNIEPLLVEIARKSWEDDGT